MDGYGKEDSLTRKSLASQDFETFPLTTFHPLATQGSEKRSVNSPDRLPPAPPRRLTYRQQLQSNDDNPPHQQQQSSNPVELLSAGHPMNNSSSIFKTKRVSFGGSPPILSVDTTENGVLNGSSDCPYSEPSLSTFTSASSTLSTNASSLQPTLQSATSSESSSSAPFIPQSQVWTVNPMTSTFSREFPSSQHSPAPAMSHNLTMCDVCGRHHDPVASHVYRYHEPIVADLLCHVCGQPMVEPLDARCGHTFCRYCIVSRAEVGATCPLDNKPLQENDYHTASVIVQRLLDKLLVICPHHSVCQQIVARCELEKHLQRECVSRNKGMSSHQYSEATGSLAPANQPENQSTNSIASSTAAIHQSSENALSISKCKLPNSLQDEGNTTPSTTSNNHERPSAIESSPLSCSTTDSSNATVNQPDSLPLSTILSSDSNLPSPPEQLSISKEDLPSAVLPPADIMRNIHPATILQFYIRRTAPYNDLGISIVGGVDTPLGCIVIQEIYADGTAARHGLLAAGDQILEVNSIDLTEATHEEARWAFNVCPDACHIIVYRERVDCPHPIQVEEIFTIILPKTPDSKLGIKLVCKKNQPGLFIMSLVKGGEAELDGRLQKDDRVLSINNVDLQLANQEDAANIIAAATDSVTFVISRLTRTQTPDLIRTANPEEESSKSDLRQDKEEQSFSPSSSCSTNPCMMGPNSQDKSRSSTPCGGLDVRQDRISSQSMPSKMATEMLKQKQLLWMQSIAGHCTEWREVFFTVKKSQNDSLGVSICGGLHSQRGDTPIYVTALAPSGVMAKSKQMESGDLLLGINGVNLLGLTHELAVQQIKRASTGSKQVHLRTLRCPLWLRLSVRFGGGAGAAGANNYASLPMHLPQGEISPMCCGAMTSSQSASIKRRRPFLKSTKKKHKTASVTEGELSFGMENFIPTWVYWLTMPAFCSMPKVLQIIRPTPTTSLGFSIVGGLTVVNQVSDVNCEGHGAPPTTTASITFNPIVVKSILPGSVADRDGRLLCGDLLISVNEIALIDISHMDAVSLLKHVPSPVRLKILSWPGTIV